MNVTVHCTDSVGEKLDAVYDRIRERAYAKWLNRGIAGMSILPFWNAAEEDLFCKPTTEVHEWGCGFTIQINCADVDPSTVRLFVSPTEMLALAPMNIPGADRWIFRYLRFPKPIDNVDATALFEAGTLRVMTTLLNAPEEAKLHFDVA